MASVLLDMSENIFAVCPSKFQCFRGRLVAAAIIEILSLFDQENYSFIKEKLGNFEKWGLWRSFYVSRDSTSGEKDRACHWQAPFHARLKRVSTSGESMSIRVRVYRRLRAASGRGEGEGERRRWRITILAYIQFFSVLSKTRFLSFPLNGGTEETRKSLARTAVMLTVSSKETSRHDAVGVSPDHLLAPF